MFLKRPGLKVERERGNYIKEMASIKVPLAHVFTGIAPNIFYVMQLRCS